jgi:hypothetical protein
MSMNYKGIIRYTSRVPITFTHRTNYYIQSPFDGLVHSSFLGKPSVNFIHHLLSIGIDFINQRNFNIYYFRLNPGGGEIFRTCSDRPWGPHSLLYNSYRVFPGGKAAGAWR